MGPLNLALIILGHIIIRYRLPLSQTYTITYHGRKKNGSRIARLLMLMQIIREVSRLVRPASVWIMCLGVTSVLCK